MSKITTTTPTTVAADEPVVFVPVPGASDKVNKALASTFVILEVVAALGKKRAAMTGELDLTPEMQAAIAPFVISDKGNTIVLSEFVPRLLESEDIADVRLAGAIMKQMRARGRIAREDIAKLKDAKGVAITTEMQERLHAMYDDIAASEGEITLDNLIIGAALTAAGVTRGEMPPLKDMLIALGYGEEEPAADAKPAKKGSKAKPAADVDDEDEDEDTEDEDEDTDDEDEDDEA